ncbi:MAG TPA: phosphate ABC transporter substrate-binding protein PstS [Verrucomicrobiae bacterium]|nr:phosphate ABC transporter substrate-binding protein PstS [Verrucomicrobiae bacterium]
MTKLAGQSWLVLCTLLIGVSLVSCSHNVGTTTGSQTVLINGAGSTFGYPIYSRWADDFHRMHPNVEVNYQSVGSGAGIRQLLAGTVDFGASDAPMTDAQLAQAKSPILHFPTVLGAVVPTYNIPGVTAELKFTPEALAGIFLGKVTRWNDPAIARVNTGLKLPSGNIVVIHRSDGSGTSFIWTDYLSKVSAEWKAKVGAGTSVNWPVGLGGKGSEGVSGLIQQTPDSIGYVELTYAIQNHILYGSVQNSSGAFVKASLDSVTAAAASAADSMPKDFRVSITNATGKDAYPVASFTWLLVPAQISDPTKRDAIKSFLHWMLTKGQNDAEPLAYAKLPADVSTKEDATISEIR